MLPEIVKRAMVETVVSIGQLTEQDKRTLDRYVKRGYLSKGKGGPFPKEKTVYAFPGYDFVLWRQRYVNYMMTLAELDQRAAERRAGKE